MLSSLSRVIRPLRWIGLLFLVVPVQGQSELNLVGAIDFRVHSAPDSLERSIDGDDLGRLAKEKGMRGLVFTNHEESTAAMAYLVQKAAPGVETFGGVALNRAVGGINVEAVKHLSAMKGGRGKVVWLPTIDSENFITKLNEKRQAVPVIKDGRLVPEVIELLDFMAQHPDMVLETGDMAAADALLVIHEAHVRGVAHVVATNPSGMFVAMTPAQLQQAARDGAYLEFVYRATLGAKPQRSMKEYANFIRQAGPEHCVLGTDYGPGGPDAARWLSPQGMLDFMEALRKEGFSVAEINLMAKTNPARVLGLKP